MQHGLIQFQHPGEGQLQLRMDLSSSPYEHPLRDSLGNTRRKRSSLPKVYVRDLLRTLRYIEPGKCSPDLSVCF